MVRTLSRINKLIEIAMLAYTIAFKILMIGGKLVASIIEMGGRLGLKCKKEDSVGRVLKGLSTIILLEVIIWWDGDGFAPTNNSEKGEYNGKCYF